MDTEELRRRLERLHVGRARPNFGPSAVASAVGPVGDESPFAKAFSQSSGDVTRGAPLANRRIGGSFPSTLETLIPGEEMESAAGRHYRVLRPLDRWFAGLSDAATAGSFAPVAAAEPHADLTHLAVEFPRGVLFVDLETCGFSGSPIFLIGTLYCDDGQIVLDQRLARDYREEISILDAFWELASGRNVLATFNGKSFDWPMLCDRTACHRLHKSWDFAIHADLLHHARRAWKHRLPNCRLKTLESQICRRQRGADIPGGEIPAAYHAFVRDGDARSIRTILYHNAMDLITLAEVAWHLMAAPVASRAG